MSESLFECIPDYFRNRWEYLRRWWLSGVRAADEFVEAVLNRYGWTAL